MRRYNMSRTGTMTSVRTLKWPHANVIIIVYMCKSERLLCLVILYYHFP